MLLFGGITGLERPSLDTWFRLELGQVQYCERLTCCNNADFGMHYRMHISRINKYFFVFTRTFLYFRVFSSIFLRVLCKDDKLGSIQCFCVYTMPEKYNLVFLISSNKRSMTTNVLATPNPKKV